MTECRETESEFWTHHQPGKAGWRTSLTERTCANDGHGCQTPNIRRGDGYFWVMRALGSPSIGFCKPCAAAELPTTPAPADPFAGLMA
ncbi:MAG: hypothetical protein GY925_22290 [Actinomycetia bacterium]|nr:hypothetical protein [Actinomycetes bacterium]